MADDMGWGDVGFRQHARIETPSLDAMAGDGVSFERFYSAAPVCSPTRGSCLTGRHPHRYGIHHANDGHLPEAETTLAEILLGAGYATGHFGKWHLGTLSREEADSNRGGRKHAEHYSPPWLHGFERCFSTEAKVPTFNPLIHPRTGEAYGTAYWDETGTRVAGDLSGDDSAVIMDRVIPFIEEASNNARPFFAVVWFHSPHKPLVAGPEDREPFGDLDETVQHYYGTIRAMDREVGRLRSVLADLGVAKNTLLWFTSDNGPEGNVRDPGSTAGLRGRKSSLYEGGIRVPGLLVWPALQGIAGRIVATPAVTSDILPTVCDLLSLGQPTVVLDGHSLAPWIKTDREEARARPIGFESRIQVAWIDDRFKLVGKLDPSLGTTPVSVENWSLFDIVKDPRETTNLSAERPELILEMKERLQAWRRTLL